MVADATWEPPTNSFHAQHWYELEARGEIAIYDRTVAADMPAIEQLYEGLKRSVLLRLVSERPAAGCGDQIKSSARPSITPIPARYRGLAKICGGLLGGDQT